MEGGALSSLFLAIWKEKNWVVFDNDNFSPNRLKNSFITYLTSWVDLIYEGEYYCKLANVHSLVLLDSMFFKMVGICSSAFFALFSLYTSRAWPCFVNILFSLLIKKKKKQNQKPCTDPGALTPPAISPYFLMVSHPIKAIMITRKSL